MSLTTVPNFKTLKEFYRKFSCIFQLSPCIPWSHTDE